MGENRIPNWQLKVFVLSRSKSHEKNKEVEKFSSSPLCLPYAQKTSKAIAALLVVVPQNFFQNLKEHMYDPLTHGIKISEAIDKDVKIQCKLKNATFY